jgi:hypothetical protein
MARSIWSGTISFGLIAIPVKMFTAVRQKGVSFNQLDDPTMGRIRYQKVSEQNGEEVPSDQIVKGYEITRGRYIKIDPDELEPFVRSHEDDRPRGVRRPRPDRPDRLREALVHPGRPEIAPELQHDDAAGFLERRCRQSVATERRHRGIRCSAHRTTDHRLVAGGEIGVDELDGCQVGMTSG